MGSEPRRLCQNWLDGKCWAEIAIECILSNKPVITLIHTINNTSKNCKYISDIKTELPKIITIVLNNKFPKLTDEEKVNYINVLNSSSFKGIVSDPFCDSNCVNDENLEHLINAFDKVLNNSISKL